MRNHKTQRRQPPKFSQLPTQSPRKRNHLKMKRSIMPQPLGRIQGQVPIIWGYVNCYAVAVRRYGEVEDFAVSGN